MTHTTSLRLHDGTIEDLRELRARLSQRRTLSEHRGAVRPVTYAEAIAYALSYTLTVERRRPVGEEQQQLV